MEYNSLLGGGHHDHSSRRKTYCIVFLFALFAAAAGLLVWQAISFSNYKNNHSSNPSGTLPADWQWIVNDTKSKMNSSADPCDDFYEYVCGGYESHTVLNDGELMRIGAFYEIDQINSQIIDGILEGQWPLISDFMDSCMADAVNASSQATLLSTADQIIGQFSTNGTGVNMSSLLTVMAQLHLFGAAPFWVPSVSNNILVDGGVNYLNLQAFSMNATDVAGAILGLYGKPITSSRIANVVNLFQNLTNIIPDISDIGNSTQLVTLSQFTSISGIDLTPYLSTLNIKLSHNDSILLTSQGYFQDLMSVINATSVQTVQDFLYFHLAFAPYAQQVYAAAGFPDLPNPSLKATPKNRNLFIEESLLKKAFSGESNNTVQRANCISALESLMQDFMGILFSSVTVDQAATQAIINMTKGIENAFQNNLPKLSWIDSSSQKDVINKLNAIIQIVGHPNDLYRYRGVVLDPTQFLYNANLLMKSEMLFQFKKIGQPFERADFSFPPTIVNAFYSPNTNTINFPAGIIESPMFSTSFPKMLQYAHLGYVVGHEMTHGFDDGGRLWDANGAYIPFMDNSSIANYNIGAQCIVNQYNQYLVLPDIRSNYSYVNGLQTLNENIADLGGVKNSFRAYKNWVQQNGPEFQDGQVVAGLNNDQLFFVLLGQTWCTKATTLGLEKQLLIDPHSPSKWRVNGPLSNFDEFATAFQCKAGSKMITSPSCNLW